MGRHLVEYLAAKGVRARATARPRRDTSWFDRLGVEFVGADLTRPATLPPLFEGDVDRVFHMGAICNFSTPYEDLYPTNVAGVERITGLALDRGVRCYVQVGSTSVYGPSEGQRLTEDRPRHPSDSYGTSKRDGEDVVWRRIGEGLPAIITRPCTVYGPGCNDGAGKAFSRPTDIPAIPGDGKRKLSNVRAEDCAAAVVHLSEYDGAIGRAYNIADGSYPTLGEALCLAAESFGRPKPRLHLPLPLLRVLARVEGFVARRKGKIPDLELAALAYLEDDYVVDNQRLLATGFEFEYPDFAASMRQMADWYREHGEE